MSSSRTLSNVDIQWEHPPCAHCGSAQRETVITTFDYEVQCPWDFTVVRCAQCGLMYTSPRPVIGQLIKYFYPDDYLCFVRDEETSGQEGGILGRFFDERTHSPRRKHFEDHFGNQSISLLDIGCGDGYFLRHLKNKTDWTVRGLEPNEKMVEMVRRMGIDADCGLIETMGYEDASFHAVTLTHVLEHSENPLAMLKEIHRILKPGGMLLVEVPNFNALNRTLFGRYWWGYHLPRHTYHFSADSLGMVGRTAGFQSRSTAFPKRVGSSAWCIHIVLDKSGIPGGRSIARKIAFNSMLLTAASVPVEMLNFISGRTDLLEMTFVKPGA